MKLSENSLNVLKNFASINSGIVLNKGAVQKTIAADKAVLLQATLEDEIPEMFGIYDLNQFLGILTALKNPELKFGKNTVVIDDGELSVTYRGCEANLIITPPEKDLVLKSVTTSFFLPTATSQKLIKIAAMINLPNLSVIGKDGELLLKIHERSNDTSNDGVTKIGDYAGEDFTATFKTDNLKLLPEDYNVEIQKGAFAKFENKAGTVKYFIALEAK